MTERLHFHFSLSCIGEGNGNPLQCSCLENPRDGGAWWAAIYGVAQSRTRLKQLGSSSNTVWRHFDPYLNISTIQRYFEVIRGIWTWTARCDDDVEMMLKHNDLLEMHTVFTGGMIGYLGFTLKDSRSKKANWRWKMAEATLAKYWQQYLQGDRHKMIHYPIFSPCMCSFLNKTLRKSGSPKVLHNISKGNYCWGVAPILCTHLTLYSKCTFLTYIMFFQKYYNNL